MKIRKPTKKQVWKDVAFKVKSAFPKFGDAPETIRVDIEDKIDELEATLPGSVTIKNFTNMVTDAMMEMYFPKNKEVEFEEEEEEDIYENLDDDEGEYHHPTPEEMEQIMAIQDKRRQRSKQDIEDEM